MKRQRSWETNTQFLSKMARGNNNSKGGNAPAKANGGGKGNSSSAKKSSPEPKAKASGFKGSTQIYIIKTLLPYGKP